MTKTDSFTVGALRARFADESMPWTRPHVESLINQIEELTKQRDEGWKNFYALRKQVAEERHPGMTAVVHAHEPSASPIAIGYASGLAQETSAEPFDDWRPIGTEPQGGQSFVVYCSDNKCQYIVSRNSYGEFCVMGGSGTILTRAPSHWRPLQSPPNRRAES